MKREPEIGQDSRGGRLRQRAHRYGPSKGVVGLSLEVPEERIKVAAAPRRAGLLLENEAGLRRMNPPWRLVDEVVRGLDLGTGNSFCSLNCPTGSYVQTLRGFNGWHLECRFVSPGSGYVHYRASYPGAKSHEMELKKHDYVNKGQYRDLLHVDDVIEAFSAFYRSGDLSALFHWRPIDI